MKGAPQPIQTTPAGASAALGAAVLWGVGNVAIARSPLGGLALGFHRLWIGALLYLAVFLLAGGRLRRTSFRYGLPGSAAFGLNISAFFLAIKNTTVADAVTISALQPIVILLVAGALFGEVVRARHIWCTVLAVGGVVMVVRGSTQGGDVTLFGEVMAVLALASWAAYFIVSKQARRHLDTLEYLTVVFIGAIPVLALFGLLSGQLFEPANRLDLTNLGWVLLVVLLPGSGHLLVNWAHNHTTITLTSLLTLLMPVLSTALAAWWLDQAVVAVQVLGIAVVLVALAIVIVGDARSAARTPAEAGEVA